MEREKQEIEKKWIREVQARTRAQEDLTSETREIQDRRAIEDIDMAAYEKDMNMKLLREDLWGAVMTRLEEEFQKCCHEEFDHTQTQEKEIRDLYESQGKSPPPLDDKVF